MEVKGIPISEITLGALNVRKDMHSGMEDSTLQDLAKSINEKGLLSPIIVLQRGENNYELIAGQRRYLACQLLAWKTIPAIIRTDLRDVDAKIISLIENVHRADLHPLDKAVAYQQIYEEYKSYARISKETGVSTQTVKRYLSLLKLAPTIQQLLTTSDGPAGICTLAKLAELFPEFNEQEYVLEMLGKFKQQVQLEILKRSEGDVMKIESLCEKALRGCFNVVLCKGIDNCPFIPEERLQEIKHLIAQTHDAQILYEV